MKSFSKQLLECTNTPLYVDVRDNDSSPFIKIGKNPARFFLRTRSHQVTDEVATKLEAAGEGPPKKAMGYKERELHPVLTYFAYADPVFNRGRQVITKTIGHEKSTGSGVPELDSSRHRRLLDSYRGLVG